MYIRDLFASDVTRDIPPVVYFHEQSPEKLATEVSEYIVTGGWPEGHPNHRRVPVGIHEQYVNLLTAMTSALDLPGGPSLPNSWISGFYGSGKSSFAKLLGLALDGVALPDGSSLAEAWLNRDRSPKSANLREAWAKLRQKVDPLAVVFDVGGVARDDEHVHSVAVRQVQLKLGYCGTEALVADFELKLERDGEWPRFEQVAAAVLGEPWSAVKNRALAEDEFSHVMSVMYPEKYTDPMSWFTSRGGTDVRTQSPEESVKAIQDMVKFRRPSATLFLVVDEVSQYVLSSRDRVDRLRAFATALGAGMKGKAWLLALGQQKLEEAAEDTLLGWAKDRFPPNLRVHLAPTNIRDVVHQRLLRKKPAAETQLRTLFEQHRPDLKLFAYGCDAVTPEDFVEVYPMLPGQIDLILQITSALRARSARAQGDDQAIRGLLQLLGELFRDQKLADMPVGALVTLDRVYEVQHTALDADVQASMARILSQCADDSTGMMVRVAKTVALLELIQDTVTTDAKFVAQCLYDRVDRGNHSGEVTAALDELRRRNLLAYSEKHGYKIQSSAGEEWDRERRDFGVPREIISELVQEGVKWLLEKPEPPRLQTRPFPWKGYFSDGRRADDVVLRDPRDEAAVVVDCRLLVAEERTESTWVKRSAEPALANRLVWLAGDTDTVEQTARELRRSRAMVSKYDPRRESLSAARKLLLQQEKNRAEDLESQLRDVIATAWMSGPIYFRGRAINPPDHGGAFASALSAVGTKVLPDLFPRFVSTQVLPAELMQLLETDLSGPSVKFTAGELGILELDTGRYVPTGSGSVPTGIREHIEAEQAVSGTALLAHFGGPPFGYTVNVIKACVAGLLRGEKVRIQPEGGNEITAIRDAGVRDVFEKDREFRRALFLPAGTDDVGFQSRAKICRFFESELSLRVDQEDHAIADAVGNHFPSVARRLRDLEANLVKLPGTTRPPEVFQKLGDAVEQCVRRCRETRPTVKLVKKYLDVLRDGVQLLGLYEAELTPEAIRLVTQAHDVVAFQAGQLADIGVVATNVDAATTRVQQHLGSERPWRDIGALSDDLTEIKSAYTAERQRLIDWQERETEAVRLRVRGRQGFSTLTSDKAHLVLRPLEQAPTITDAASVAPSLGDLRDPFLVRLHRAEAEANSALDAVLSEGDKALIRPLDLRLRNREVTTEADVEALVKEIRETLLEQVRSGTRVRLL